MYLQFQSGSPFFIQDFIFFHLILIQCRIKWFAFNAQKVWHLHKIQLRTQRELTVRDCNINSCLFLFFFSLFWGNFFTFTCLDFITFTNLFPFFWLWSLFSFSLLLKEIIKILIFSTYLNINFFNMLEVTVHVPEHVRIDNV